MQIHSHGRFLPADDSQPRLVNGQLHPGRGACDEEDDQDESDCGDAEAGELRPAGEPARHGQDASADEEACLQDCRYLMSFLPSNNLELPPRVEPNDDPEREDPELDTLVPDDPQKPYDMRDVVARVVDDGEFFEVHEHYAQNIICGFSRLDGYAVGVVGNQPKHLAGVLDIESS